MISSCDRSDSSFTIPRSKIFRLHDRLTDGSAHLSSPCEVTRVGGCFHVNRSTDGSAHLLTNFRIVVRSMDEAVWFDVHMICCMHKHGLVLEVISISTLN